MALPLLGLGMMVGGGALQGIAASDRASEMRGAGRRAGRAQQQYFQGERDELMNFHGQMTDERHRRIGTMGETWQGIQGSYDQPRRDPELEAKMQAAQSQAAGANPTGGAVGGGQMVAGVGQAQGLQDGTTREHAISSLLQEDFQNRVQGRQQESMLQQQIADLTAMARQADAREQLQIGQAIRQLQWQLDSIGLQRAIDSASRVGGGMNMAGGMLSQGGNMMFGMGMNQLGAGSPNAPTPAGGGAPLGPVQGQQPLPPITEYPR